MFAVDLFAFFDIMIQVIFMISFEKAVVTNIRQATVVHSKKGHYYKTENRLCFGLSFCMGGQITYTMNGKTYISNQSNAILLPQGGSYSLAGNKEGLFPVINFSCTGLDCKEITILPLDDPQGCIKRFKTLQQQLLRSESQLRIFSTFYDLLDHLIPPREQIPNLLHIVMKYIDDHIQDPTLSNVVLAKHICISEVYLRKLFRTHYHTTPRQYILDIRIRKARQMLINTPFAVSTIAEECGFSSVYHFCRCFKQHTGQTPTQYALNNKTYRI